MSIPIVHTMPGQDRRAKTTPHRCSILITLAVAQLMIVLDSSIVNIALPQAQQALGIGTLADAQWVVTGYALAFGGCYRPGGSLT